MPTIQIGIAYRDPYGEKMYSTENKTMLPGFNNVEAEQRGNMLVLKVTENLSLRKQFNRSDYDCDPSFIYDVNAWCLRNGGVKVPS